MATECLTWINGAFSSRPLVPNGSTVSDATLGCNRRVLLCRPSKRGRGHDDKDDPGR